MAKNDDVFFTKKGRVESIAVNSGSTLAAFTPEADGSKLLSLKIIGNTVAATGDLIYNVNGTPIQIANDIAAAVGDDMLALLPHALDKAGNKYINMESTDKIEFHADGGVITLAAYGEDY